MFFLLLVLVCTTLSISCGKTGDLYLPGELSSDIPGGSELIEKASDGGPSSKTGSTTGR
jgi:hypothetical protein